MGHITGELPSRFKVTISHLYIIINKLLSKDMHISDFCISMYMHTLQYSHGYDVEVFGTLNKRCTVAFCSSHERAAEHMGIIGSLQ